MSVNKKSMFHLPKSSLFILVVLAIAGYVILPQLHSFRDSFTIMRGADVTFLALAGVFVALTYLAGTACYLSIGYYKLRFWRTVLVQLAYGFTSRILPASTGGIATNVAYLMKQKGGGVAAATVVGLVSAISIVGHAILFAGLVLVTRQPLGATLQFRPSLLKVILGAVVVCGLVTYLLIKTNKFKHFNARLKPIVLVIKFVSTHPVRLVLALISSMALTTCYAFTLYLVMHSLGIQASALQAFYVLTVGVTAIALTPTPGGIGGAEAGLVAAQVSVGIPLDQALPMALLYRLLTFWLPMVPGFVAFRLALKRGYLS